MKVEVRHKPIVEKIFLLLKKQETVIINIAGPSCSKKSTLAHYLSEICLASSISRSLDLSTDNYFYGLETYRRYIEDPRLDKDQPSAYDLILCAEHFQEFRKGLGREVIHPHFFIRKLLMTEERKLVSQPLIILEGLYSLIPELAENADIKIFIDAPLEECRKLRIKRSLIEHGIPEEKTARHFDTVVMPAYYQFVAPTRKNADVILTGV